MSLCQGNAMIPCRYEADYLRVLSYAVFPSWVNGGRSVLGYFLFTGNTAVSVRSVMSKASSR